VNWIGAMHDDADYDDIVGLVTFGATNPEIQNYAKGGRHDPQCYRTTQRAGN